MKRALVAVARLASGLHFGQRISIGWTVNQIEAALDFGGGIGEKFAENGPTVIKLPCWTI